MYDGAPPPAASVEVSAASSAEGKADSSAARTLLNDGGGLDGRRGVSVDEGPSTLVMEAGSRRLIALLLVVEVHVALGSMDAP